MYSGHLSESVLSKELLAKSLRGLEVQLVPLSDKELPNYSIL